MNRRILVSIMIIGLIGAGLGSTTMAMFNDTETSQDNQFTAGELDLRVDWDESYNGEHVETQEMTNEPGAIFEFEDLKPGDHGEATISLHLEDNPGWIWMNMNQTSNWDNACTEPEREAEGQCGSVGELDEELEFVIWADDGDNVLQDDENVVFEGTAQELEEQSTAEGLLLDGDTSTNETEAFPGEETGYIGMKWNLPLETGNHIQGDSVSYDVEFYTEQRRHNDNPDNPWGSEDDTEEPEQPEDPVNETPENEPPVASFVRANEEPYKTTVGNEVRFYSTSTDDDEISKKKWDLGDGTTKFGQDVWHAWDEAGNYTVSLEVTDSEGETDTATRTMEVTADDSADDPVEEEPAEPVGNLTFNDQMVNEDGEVFINDASTDTGSAIFVTYEDGNETIIAAIENAPKDLDNYNYTVDIEQSGVPGEYTARMVEKPIAYAYNSGDVIEDDTLDDQYFSQSAQISAAEDAEDSVEYTAEQAGDTITIEPIEGDETVQELYDFRLPNSFDNEADNNASNGATYGGGSTYGSAGTEDLQQGDTSIMFLYEGPEGVSLVVVHEGQGSQDGGSATFEITDLEGGEWKVKDDLYLKADGSKAGSNYDIWNVDSTPQTIDWTWGSGGSDGGAYSPLAENFSFTISPAFNEEAGLYDDNFYDGEVDEWQVLSGDRSNPDRTSLNMSEDVTVSAN